MTICISGIEVDVFGDINGTIGIFLLHGRTRKRQDLHFMAKGIIESNSRCIVLVFDHRNHGNRIVDKERNKDWENGNNTHHLDMWSILLGGIQDCQLLMDMLPCYSYKIGKWGICGVSLGGHLSLMLTGIDARIKYCVSLIGSINVSILLQSRQTNTLQMDNEFIKMTDDFCNGLNFKNASILMLNGSKDELVPFNSNSKCSDISTIVYKE